jgi:hypothetical protein
MQDFRRLCWNCEEPFEVNLPQETVRAGYDKCDIESKTRHNLEYKLECQNCYEINTFYYCTGDHPETVLPND